MTLLATSAAMNILLVLGAAFVAGAFAFHCLEVWERGRYSEPKTYVPRAWLPEQDDDDVDLEVWR